MKALAPPKPSLRRPSLDSLAARAERLDARFVSMQEGLGEPARDTIAEELQRVHRLLDLQQPSPR